MECLWCVLFCIICPFHLLLCLIDVQVQHFRWMLVCILQSEFGFKSQYSWGQKFLSKCDVHVLGKWQYITAHELWGTQEQCYWSCEVLKSSVIEAVCHLGCDIAGGQIVMMFWWIAVLHWTAWPNDGGANTSSGCCVELHTQWCSVTFQNSWIFHM